MRPLASACLLALLVVAHLATATSVPQVVAHQGRLLDAGDTGVTGAIAFTFEFHDNNNPNKHEPLWTETRTLNVLHGSYAALLGDVANGGQALPASLFARPELYLSVTVDTTELQPRLRLASAPYALAAEHAALADRATLADDATLFGGKAPAHYLDAANLAGKLGAGVSYEGTPLADAQIASAAKWNAKLDEVADETVEPAAISGNRIKPGTLPADRLDGPLGDAFIGAVAASKLTGQVTDAQITGLAANKLTGQIADAQVAGLAANKLTGQVTDSQIQSIASSKVTGPLVVPVGSAPSSPATGTLYFDTTAKQLKLWDGTAWMAVFDGNPACGDTSDRPATSCKAIKANCAGKTSGPYWVKPGTISAPVRVYCDLSGSGGWTLCSNFVDTAADELRSDVGSFEFGSDWSGWNGTVPGAPIALTSSGSLNCTTFAQALGATEARFECTKTAGSASGAAAWTSDVLTLATTPTLTLGTTLGTQILQTHGEWGWGGYGRASWVLDDAAYPNCSGNACGFDATRWASGINIELAGGYFSPGCAGGCGASPRNYTGAEEGGSCGGTDTTAIAGERYSIFIR